MEFKGKRVTVLDKRGIEVQAGDVIAMGFREGSSGAIRLGTILEYVEYEQQVGRPNCYLKVQWFKIDGYEPEKPTRIYVTTESNLTSIRPAVNKYWFMHEFIKVALPDD